MQTAELIALPLAEQPQAMETLWESLCRDAPEIKHLREPIAEKLKGAGSAMFAILADGKVVASWKGTRKSPEEILQIIEEQQKLLASATTPNPPDERDARALPSP